MDKQRRDEMGGSLRRCVAADDKLARFFGWQGQPALRRLPSVFSLRSDRTSLELRPHNSSSDNSLEESHPQDNGQSNPSDAA